jgi:hypothetical protein
MAANEAGFVCDRCEFVCPFSFLFQIEASQFFFLHFGPFLSDSACSTTILYACRNFFLSSSCPAYRCHVVLLKNRSFGLRSLLFRCSRPDGPLCFGPFGLSGQWLAARSNGCSRPTPRHKPKRKHNSATQLASLSPHSPRTRHTQSSQAVRLGASPARRPVVPSSDPSARAFSLPSFALVCLSSLHRHDELSIHPAR